MPRRARLAVAGIPWHIIQRGNNRAACFHCANDYHRYLQDLAEQAAKFAALGADFVAPSARIWRGDDALRRIAEIDNAVRHVRRAA